MKSAFKPGYTAHDHHDHIRYLDAIRVDFRKRYEHPITCNKTREDLDILKSIGSGAYGAVYMVRDKVMLSYHALKVVEKAVIVERKHVKQILLEKKIMESVLFPFVITSDCAFKDNVYLYFLIPFIAGGDMFTLIQRHGILSDESAKFYATQIILGLEYLHHCSIVHRDLKPENVLIDCNGYIKICDYGFCKILKNKTWTLCGTPEYLAPEIILSKGYSYGVDWWSLGIFIYEMETGHPPFMSSEPKTLYDKILTGHFKCPDIITSDCKHMIRGLLTSEPKKRLGCLQGGVFDIKSHAWFHDIVWESIYHQKVEPPFKPISVAPGDTTQFDDTGVRKLQKSSINLYEQQFIDF